MKKDTQSWLILPFVESCFVFICLRSLQPLLWVGKCLSEKRWCELCALLAPAGSIDLDQHLSVWKRYKSDCSVSANCHRFLMHSWTAASLTPHKSCNRSGLYQVCMEEITIKAAKSDKDGLELINFGSLKVKILQPSLKEHPSIPTLWYHRFTIFPAWI